MMGNRTERGKVSYWVLRMENTKGCWKANEKVSCSGMKRGYSKGS